LPTLQFGHGIIAVAELKRRQRFRHGPPCWRLHGIIAVAELKHRRRCRSVTEPGAGLHGIIAVAELKQKIATMAATMTSEMSPRHHRRGRIEATFLASQARSIVRVSTASSPWPN